MDEAQKPMGSDAPQAVPQINALLSDPAVLAKIGTVMSALQASNPPPSIEESKSSSTDGLAAVLSDPKVLEKLPQMISTLKPLLDAGLLAPSASASSNAPTVPTAATPNAHLHDRDNLLLSLKPFLSSERRDAVDLILRIEKLGEIFKQIK